MSAKQKKRSISISLITVLVLQALIVVLFGPISPASGTVNRFTTGASQDSYIRSDNQNNNYGNNDDFRTRDESGRLFRSVIQFDLSSIPAGAKIEDAELQILRENGPNGIVTAIHRITTSWTEGGVTWNNPWSSNGGDYAALTQSIALGDNSGWKMLDVTPDVQLFVDGTNPNYGWLIKEANENDDRQTQRFSSKEFATAGDRPVLDVAYVIGTTVVAPNTANASTAEAFTVTHTNTGGTNGDEVHQVSFTIPAGYTNIPTTAGGYGLTVSGGKNWTVTPPAGSSGPQTVTITANTAGDDLTNSQNIQIDFTVTTPASAGATNWDSGITGAFGGTYNPAAQVVTITVDPDPDTAITDPTGGTLSGTSKLITGTATDGTAVDAVEVEISRDSDGWYWNGSTWQSGQTWNSGTITSGQGTPSANWQYSWTLPTDDGGGYNIQARAIDDGANSDPTPASVSVNVDNMAPTANTFSIDSGAVYTTSTSVTLAISASGANEMRFAETTATLSGATWEPYGTSTSFFLSASNGTKTVYAQYKDTIGNETNPGIANASDEIFLDDSAPTVTGTNPVDGASGVDAATIVVATLGENDAIDASTINTNTFYLKDPADSTVTATVTYDGPSNEARLTPSALLAFDTTYTAHLTTAVADMAGNTLAAEEIWSFKTAFVGVLDTVISDPTGGTLSGAAKLITGTATDDSAVDAVEVEISRDSDGWYWNGSTWVSGQNWISATITSGQGTPGANWQYSWTLPPDNGGGYNIQARTIDDSANPDPTPASVSVSVDNEAPTPGSFTIEGGAVYANQVTVTLNLSAGGATDMRFAESSAALSAASWEAYNASTTFNLSSSDGTKTVYSQYKDGAGNESVAGAANTFDDIFLDKTRPTISATFPTDGATDVGVLTVLNATINENNSMNASTINNVNFYLRDSLNNTITASVTYDSGANIASLTPDVPLSFESTYTAHLTTGVADTAGNTLETEKVWSFTTILASSHPPGAPTSVNVTSEDMNNHIEWTATPMASDGGADFDPSSGKGGYNIYRSTSPSGPWTKINGALPTTSIDDDSFGPRGVYYYMVRAEDLGGSESPDSNAADNRKISLQKDTSTSGAVQYRPSNGLLDLDIPAQSTVTNVSIQTSTRTVSGITPATEVYYLTPNGTSLAPPATLTFKTPADPTGATMWFDEGSGWQVVTGGVYVYDKPNKTVSYNKIDHFSYYTITNPSDSTPPSAPATMTLSSVASGEVKIDWLAATDDQSGISGYIIWRSLQAFDDGSMYSLARLVAAPGDVLTYTDNSVQSGEEYFYGVTAENGAGLQGILSNVDSITVSGKTPPHWNFSGTTSQCPFCHTVHRSPASKRIFRKAPEIETCLVCHDGTGSDFDIRTKWEGLAAHDTSMTASPDTNIKCVRCHNPHGIDVGIRMTREVEEEMCFKCHNYAGSTRNGWNPQYQFSDTNTVIQSYHAIRGTTADGLTGAKIECTNCHNPMQAQRGTMGSDFVVRVADPFNVFNLWRDNDRGITANFVNFCLNCHKPAPWPVTTASATQFVPYTIAFPSVNSADSPFFFGWDKTLFRDSSPTQTAHFENNVTCQNCHIPHGSRNRRLMAWSDDDNYYNDDPGVSKEENLCFQCHGSTSHTDFPSAPNIEDEFSKTYAMPITNADIHWDTENSANLGFNAGSPDNRHAECYDCHDPHKAKAGNRGENNLAGPPLNGAMGLAVTNGAAGSVPTYTPTVVTYEYQVCFKCHTSYTTRGDSLRYFDTSYNGGGAFVQGDKSVEFNPNNSSYMPVEAAGRNKSDALNDALLGGLTVDSVISCTDCHNNNATDDASGWVSNSSSGPKGPHGSSNVPILRANYRLDISEPNNYSSSNFELCFLCHDEDALVIAEDIGSGASTNFMQGDESLHQLHLEKREVAVCRNCHYNAHGNQEANNTIYRIIESSGTFTYTNPPPPSPGFSTSRLINFSPDVRRNTGGNSVPMWQYNKITRRRSCYIRCHGGTMDPESYTPPASGDVDAAYP